VFDKNPANDLHPAAHLISTIRQAFANQKREKAV
jgi:hypothetical protein